MNRLKWILIAGAFLALALTLVLLCKRSREPSVGQTSSGILTQSTTHEPASRLPSSALQQPAPLASTIRDRTLRDQMRERIHAEQRGVPLDRAVARNAGTLPQGDGPAPASSSPTLDRSYIQQVVREDFAPMAKQCYESALAQNPKLSGKLVVFFTIVGDDKIGGIVESATIDEASTLTDPKLQQCFTESMMSIAFKAPPARGMVTVKYPFLLTPDEPGKDAGA